MRQLTFLDNISTSQHPNTYFDKLAFILSGDLNFQENGNGNSAHPSYKPKPAKRLVLVRNYFKMIDFPLFIKFSNFVLSSLTYASISALVLIVLLGRSNVSASGTDNLIASSSAD